MDVVCDLQSLMPEGSYIVNRIQGEILIVNEVSRTANFGLVCGDKYIGRSKGACYFCYSWVQLHHNGLWALASHNKAIIGGRGQNPNISGKKHCKKMLEKMVKTVEQDIVRHLLEAQSAKTFRHHCSTDGPS